MPKRKKSLDNDELLSNEDKELIKKMQEDTKADSLDDDFDDSLEREDDDWDDNDENLLD